MKEEPDIFMVVRQECRNRRPIGRPMPAWHNPYFASHEDAKRACEKHRKAVVDKNSNVFVIKKGKGRRVR